jgi:transposase
MDWVQARDQGDRTTRLGVEEAHKEQMDWASKERKPLGPLIHAILTRQHTT